MKIENKACSQYLGIAVRINEIAARVGGKRSLAKMINISESQLHRYVASDRDIKLTVLMELAKVGGVTLEWLATGEEPKNLLQSVESQEGQSGYADIPIFDVRSRFPAQGHSPAKNRQNKLAFSKKWLEDKALNAGDLVIVQARGDSMLPTLSDGDTLMVDTSQKRLEDGLLYALSVEEYLLVKRVQISIGEGILLLSDNKDYQTQLVTFKENSQLDVLGRIVWVGREL